MGDRLSRVRPFSMQWGTFAVPCPSREICATRGEPAWLGIPARYPAAGHEHPPAAPACCTLLTANTRLLATRPPQPRLHILATGEVLVQPPPLSLHIPSGMGATRNTGQLSYRELWQPRAQAAVTHPPCQQANDAAPSVSLLERASREFHGQHPRAGGNPGGCRQGGLVSLAPLLKAAKPGAGRCREQRKPIRSSGRNSLLRSTEEAQMSKKGRNSLSVSVPAVSLARAHGVGGRREGKGSGCRVRLAFTFGD